MYINKYISPLLGSITSRCSGNELIDRNDNKMSASCLTTKPRLVSTKEVFYRQNVLDMDYHLQNKRGNRAKRTFVLRTCLHILI